MSAQATAQVQVPTETDAVADAKIAVMQALRCAHSSLDEIVASVTKILTRGCFTPEETLDALPGILFAKHEKPLVLAPTNPEQIVLVRSLRGVTAETALNKIAELEPQPESKVPTTHTEGVDLKGMSPSFLGHGASFTKKAFKTIAELFAQMAKIAQPLNFDPAAAKKIEFIQKLEELATLMNEALGVEGGFVVGLSGGGVAAWGKPGDLCAGVRLYIPDIRKLPGMAPTDTAGISYAIERSVVETCRAEDNICLGVKVDPRTGKRMIRCFAPCEPTKTNSVAIQLTARQTEDGNKLFFGTAFPCLRSELDVARDLAIVIRDRLASIAAKATTVEK